MVALHAAQPWMEADVRHNVAKLRTAPFLKQRGSRCMSYSTMSRPPLARRALRLAPIPEELNCDVGAAIVSLVVGRFYVVLIGTFAKATRPV